MAELEIKRGATEVLRTVITPASLVVDSTIYFMAKRSKADSDDDAIISKVSGDGISVSDLDVGEILTTIDPADTRTLPNHRLKLYYEFEIEKDDAVYAVEDGTLYVNPEVVQRTL